MTHKQIQRVLKNRVWKLASKKYTDGQNHTPGFAPSLKNKRSVFWLAIILDCPLPSRVSTVAVEQCRQAYSSGGCAGMAEMENTSRVTGLPDYPPDRKVGGHPLSAQDFSDWRRQVK